LTVVLTVANTNCWFAWVI